jgi:hypothetical protein
MSTLRSRLVVSAAVVGVVMSVVAGPASAHPAGGTAASTRVGGPGALMPLVSSRYLAGYRATDPEHVSDVVIKAVDVPEVSCSDPRFEGVAVGAGSEPVLGELEYFAGIFVTCVSGQPQYLMAAIIGDGNDQETGIEPGDQAQIVITLQCDAYPTCDVFSSATSLDTDTNVFVETTIDVTTDSAVFGAFPLFGQNRVRPAPVPAFGKVRLRGCLFDQHLLARSAQRLVLARHGKVRIRPSKIDVGSFTLKRAG